MRNTHNSLIVKMSSTFFISFLIASPASAWNCPTGYGKVKDYDDDYISAVMLDYKAPYSPEYLIKCEKIPYRYDGFKCGNLNINTLQQSYLSIQPADPSLKEVSFEDISSDYLGRFNLPGDFQDEKTKEWCEMDGLKAGSSSSATCYSERRDTKVYIPSEYFINARFMGIRKKVFIERIRRTIAECRIISF